MLDGLAEDGGDVLAFEVGRDLWLGGCRGHALVTPAEGSLAEPFDDLQVEDEAFVVQQDLAVSVVILGNTSSGHQRPLSKGEGPLSCWVVLVDERCDVAVQRDEAKVQWARHGRTIIYRSSRLGMIDRYKRQALTLDVIDFEEHVEVEETFAADGNRVSAKVPGSETAFLLLQAPDGEVIRVQMPHAQFDDIIRRVFPYDFEGMPIADFVIERLKKQTDG